MLEPSEWFLFALSYNLKNFSGSCSWKQRDNGHCDPYMEEFTQNPYLVLLRRYLDYFEFMNTRELYEFKDKKNMF